MFLNGFNDLTQIQKSLSLLADDYRFKNPMVELNSKAEFLVLAQEMGAVLTGINIINLAEEGHWVAALYEFKSSIPGLEVSVGSKWFRLDSGVIRESHLIYDASHWRKVYDKLNR
jgi:hypothetical protein